MHRSEFAGQSSGPPVSGPLGQSPQNDISHAPLLTRHQRYLLIARARWFFLGFAAAYGFCAGLGYSLSAFGWFLTPSQFLGLVLTLATILAYNTLFSVKSDRIAQCAWGDHLQVVLDFLCVTLLIHFSGGAASWFWPVYLLVTLEAAILVERRREVVILGLLGGFCYGVVLGGEFFDLLPNVSMPFIDPNLHHNELYLFLLWLWVSLLNAIVALIGYFLMSALRRQHDRVQATEQRLKDFLDQANDLIFSITPQGDFLYVNQAWRRVLGYNGSALDGLSINDIIDPAMRVKCLEEIRKVTSGEAVEPLEGRLVTQDGELVEVEGSLTCSAQESDDQVWIICRDITARKKAQEQLYHMAHHDLLTGLPNRLFFADRLQQAQALAKRVKQQCAILFLDLDRFKIINDTLGHAVGDELLKEVGLRLRNCVREVDTVARLGGDEFAVVLVNLKSSIDAEQVAGKIIKALAKPIMADEHELFITTSIGISVYPKDGDESTELIKRADVAMYQAKAVGRNNYQVYDVVMDLDSERRMKLESGLRKAIDREEFCIFYQPKIDSVSGDVTALEALIRWEHPELGLLSPAEFLSMAEETGLIIPIGEWVLRRACQDNCQWQEQGLPPVRVAVNLSGFQLQQKNFVKMVAEVVKETGLAGEYLEFEIAETVIMQNPEFAVKVLTQIRDMGIHISIDDFGTGYSSLAHLKRFSVNTLKIDRAFVRDIEANSTDAAITSAIISMGNSLNLKVIAEGVETEGQYHMLRDRHCDEMQGYLFSKPVPSQDVEQLLRNGSKRVVDKPQED